MLKASQRPENLATRPDPAGGCAVTPFEKKITTPACFPAPSPRRRGAPPDPLPGSAGTVLVRGVHTSAGFRDFYLTRKGGTKVQRSVAYITRDPDARDLARRSVHRSSPDADIPGTPADMRIEGRRPSRGRRDVLRLTPGERREKSRIDLGQRGSN